jgi:hypothetical protein
MLEELQDNLKNYENIRKIQIGNHIPSALLFNPLPVGFKPNTLQQPLEWGAINEVRLPTNKEDLAFYSVRQLAELIRIRAITSEELARFFIDRLKKHDTQLHCVITITEELAMAQARKADQEIAAGKYRGILHGIPYGAKDLLEEKGYKKNWGGTKFKDKTWMPRLFKNWKKPERCWLPN